MFFLGGGWEVINTYNVVFLRLNFGNIANFIVLAEANELITTDTVMYY